MAIDIPWEKKFELGRPRIDSEHQVFLDLIRHVSEASERQEPKDGACACCGKWKSSWIFTFTARKT